MRFTETDSGNRVVFSPFLFRLGFTGTDIGKRVVFIAQTVKFTETDTGNSLSFSVQTVEFPETDTGNTHRHCSDSDTETGTSNSF